MANPLVLAATYNKCPIHVLGGDRIDPDKMTRELGNIEAALRIPTAATGGYFTLTDPQWGGDPTGRRDNSGPMRRILEVIAGGLTSIRAIYVPGGDYRWSDNVTVTGGSHDYVTVFTTGGARMFLSDIPNTSNVEAGWMWMLQGTAAAPLVGFRMTGFEFDGNKAATAWATTSYAVVGYPDAVLKDCQIDNCWAHDFRTTGFQTFVGGIRFTAGWSTDNTAHGVGVSIDTEFGEEFAEVYDFTCTDNGGYGVDLAAGRIKAANLVVQRNTSGGGKTTNECTFLALDGFLAEDNAGVGWGHTSDGSDTPELHYDNIVCVGNGRRGFYVLTASAASTFGSIACANNGLVTPDSSDLQFGDTGSGLVRFTAGALSTEGAGNDRGILIDGDVTEYAIGSVTGIGSASQGFEDTCTGPTHGQVGTMRLLNCNQDGTSGANGAAVEVNRAGTFTVGSADFEDTQGSPTQVSGFYFANGCVGTVTKARFGADIATPYHTASNGTTVNHENTWGAIRSTSSSITADFTDGMILVDATGGARTITLKPATNMTGKVYVIKKIDASANAVTIDADGGELIDGVTTQPLAVQWASLTLRCNGTAWYIE